MSRYLKQHEKEHMKMAMLKQEETFKKQVHELHRLYRVQKLLMMTDAANAMPASVRSCEPEGDRHTRENEAAGSSRPWDAYSDRIREAPPLVLDDTDLDLTLALGSFDMAEKAAAAGKKDTSSSVDSRTSISSSSTESSSPGRRVPVNATSPNVGQRMEQPPWLPQCLSFAR